MITATRSDSRVIAKRDLMHEVRQVFGATCVAYCGLSFLYEDMRVNHSLRVVTCVFCIARKDMWANVEM